MKLPQEEKTASRQSLTPVKVNGDGTPPRPMLPLDWYHSPLQLEQRHQVAGILAGVGGKGDRAGARPRQKSPRRTRE